MGCTRRRKGLCCCGQVGNARHARGRRPGHRTPSTGSLSRNASRARRRRGRTRSGHARSPAWSRTWSLPESRPSRGARHLRPKPGADRAADRSAHDPSGSRRRGTLPQPGILSAENFSLKCSKLSGADHKRRPGTLGYTHRSAREKTRRKERSPSGGASRPRKGARVWTAKWNSSAHRLHRFQPAVSAPMIVARVDELHRLLHELQN